MKILDFMRCNCNFKSAIESTVEPQLSDHLGRGKIRSDNRKAKITGLNGVRRVGWRLDN